MRRSVRRTSRKPKRTKRSSKTRKPTKKKSSKRKKKMNAYMLALNKARKAGADSFEYNGKTYYKKVAKTGMVLYAANKSGAKRSKKRSKKR